MVVFYEDAVDCAVFAGEKDGFCEVWVSWVVIRRGGVGAGLPRASALLACGGAVTAGSSVGVADRAERKLSLMIVEVKAKRT